MFRNSYKNYGLIFFVFLCKIISKLKIVYFYKMNNGKVNINFKVMASALSTHVRAKAMAAGSTIVYRENGQLIRETPKKNRKEPLKIK